MIYFGVVLGLILLAAMVYMALNKKSNFTIRIASLIALAVMVLSIIICLFLVLMGGKAPLDESIVLVGIQQEAPKVENNNFMVLLIFAIFLFGLFAVVAVLSLRDHRKKQG